MIQEFQGEYRWLSNFAPVQITLGGIEYPSVEHAYMSAKSEDEDWKKFCADSANSPGDVKKKSKNITLVDNWLDIKLSVMKDCLRQKFSQSPFRENLMATGTQYIQEGNRWGDKFWGVCLRTGQGENNLGKLIMEMRGIL